MNRIDEGGDNDPPSTSEGSACKEARSLNWPFHRATPSNVTSIPITSRFRPSSWQPKSLLRTNTSDDSASIFSHAKSLIPDYVVNYIRGETPETLQRKREQSNWGRKTVEITRNTNRATWMSRAADLYDPFASTTHLNPSGHANENQHRGWRRLLLGWRGGAAFNTLLALVIFVVSAVCLILVVLRAGMLSGEVALYTGSCLTASNMNFGLHIVINVFGVILLAGGNYALHVLSSPTRTELAAAHNKKQWLDIGIPSLRNFSHISGFRSSLASVVLLIAVATQIIYNAVIFTSQTGLDYNVLFVAEDFLSGAQFTTAENNRGSLSRTEILALQDAASQKRLVTLTASTCAREFGGAFETSFNAVLLVTKTASTGKTSLVQTEKSGTPLSSYSTSKGLAALDGSLVQYCLARTGESQTCSVNASGLLLFVVALLNLATVIGIPLILTRPKLEPLVTVGDAIRSFMRNPDPTTINACLLTKTHIKQGRWDLQEAQYFTPKTHYWFLTPSLPRWVLTSLSWFAIAAPNAIALVVVVSTDPAGLLTPFGSATPYTTFLLPANSSISNTQMSVIAALPQLLLAILYLTVNSLLTTYWLSHEFSLFVTKSQPLRVSSDPVGAQTTSLYLTLPRPVSWLLLALFVGMGYVLSQAVFPAVIDTNTTHITAIAFSSQALLVLLGLLVVLAAIVLGMGFRREKPHAPFGNPLALRGGSCSAVLSARAHCAPGEHEPWQHPVIWGVVAEGLGMEVGHCAFSAENVEIVDASRSYA